MARPRDFKDQLSPIAAKLRDGRSIIRPVSQLVLRLPSGNGEDRFASVVDDILRWMNPRAGRALPDAAWQRQSFELSEVGAQRVAAVTLKHPKYWAARLDDADKNVPMRTWVTEIGVGVDDNGDVLFGTRLICVTRGSDELYEPSVPGFAKQVISSGSALLDGCEVTAEPKIIRSNEEVDELVALLELPNRQADVIVFSLPDGSVNANDTVSSPRELYERLKGVAHVFVLTGPASFHLTDAVGRELSVFRQAIRVYRPGFMSWLSQPSDHLLLLPQRVLDWGGGDSAFQKWLARQSLSASVRSRRREDSLPPFDQVRQMAAQMDRKELKDAGGSDAELLRMFEQENERLSADLRDERELHGGLLAEAEKDRDAAIQDANAEKAKSLARLHRLRVLEEKLSQASGPSQQIIPTSLDGFEDWCNENLAGAVELVGRAYQGVRKSDYYDPQLIYRSLLLLKDFYVPMRVESTPLRREAYESALKELELEESPTGDGVKYAADLYSVQYGSRRVPLDRHLKGRDSRDRRYGFRAYFFWDEEGQVAVVGWLPSHLDNRSS